MSFVRWFVPTLAIAATGAISYFGAAFQNGRRLVRRSDEIDRTYDRIAAMGDAAGAEMARSLPEDLPSLADACRGKLAAGAASSIIGYIAPLPADVRANLDTFLAGHPAPYDLLHVEVVPTRIVAGSVDPAIAFLVVEPTQKGIDRRPRGMDAMWTLIHADPSPLAWSRFAAIESRRGVDVLSARHVAVSLVRAAAPPSISGDHVYRGGVAVLQVRVLAMETGATTCEGKVLVEMPAEVHGAGGPEPDPSDVAASFDQAVAFGALNAVCDAGGADLCAETSRKVREVKAGDVEAKPSGDAPGSR